MSGVSMRPKSILLFERLYLASWVIGLLNTALAWPTTLATFHANPEAQALGIGFLYAVTAISLAIPLALWFFVARIGSVVAKWIFVLFIALGVVSSLYVAATGRWPMEMRGGMSAVSITLNVVAMVMLFRADARLWFARPRQPIATMHDGETMP